MRASGLVVEAGIEPAIADTGLIRKLPYHLAIPRYLADMTGFEPAAFAVTERHANQLHLISIWYSVKESNLFILHVKQMPSR